MGTSSESAANPVYSVVGDRYVFLTTGEETAGACCVVEVRVPPGGGPPPHVHRREDELFYVVEGEFEFLVAGESVRLSAGGSLFGRREVPHTFKNVGPGPGKLIIAVTPAGLERFFMEVGTRLDGPEADPIPPTPNDFERLLRAAPAYGLEIPAGG
ncbi:cupin domain-containing protein [Planctomyces sp. SH-PL62]|uniref:cupin domain-containing protein n=1 Tax=Planctomyces sp. SH-PL62 TaxID=1636152 RepID=UPI00078C8819|nr:cupin domain-containing protein [Planctomyces sp. SH-PL62]AMV38092.1 Cupin domain protein [Planctomyces sp. SH-PL62]